MFTWEAIYKDGAILKQVGDDGTRVSADNIDRDKINIFNLYRNDKKVYTLFLNEGEKLIYRKRVKKSSDGEESACHVIGWRKHIAVEDLIHDEVVQSITYYFEDGTIEVKSNFEENHPWHYSPTLRDFEK